MNEAYLRNELDAKVANSPFATLEDAARFLEWYRQADAKTNWDDNRADVAKELVRMSERIHGEATKIHPPAGPIEEPKNTCPRCEGDGKAHGSDRPFESHGPDTYPGPCPECKGSGVKEPVT